MTTLACYLLATCSAYTSMAVLYLVDLGSSSFEIAVMSRWRHSRMKLSSNACLRTRSLGASITCLFFLQWLYLIEAEPMQAIRPPTPPPLDIGHIHIDPDFHRCHPKYGTGLSLDSCLRALSQLPTQGDHEGYMDFFENIHNYHPHYHRPRYHLPLQFVDPHCKQKPRVKR